MDFLNNNKISFLLFNNKLKLEKKYNNYLNNSKSNNNNIPSV